MTSMMLDGAGGTFGLVGPPGSGDVPAGGMPLADGAVEATGGSSELSGLSPSDWLEHANVLATDTATSAETGRITSEILERMLTLVPIRE